MTQEQRPPQEFLDWLDANYSWGDANKWRVNQTGIWSAYGSTWANDPVFQHWTQYTPEGQQYFGQQPAQRQAQLESELQKATSPQQLNTMLFEFEDAGEITEEQGAGYYDQFYDQSLSNLTSSLPEGGMEYLNQYTSTQDLQDRLFRLGVDESTQDELYTLVRPDASEMELRKMGGVRAERLAEQEQLQYGKQVGKIQGENAVTQALEQVRNNPLVTKADLASIQPLIEEFKSTPYQAGLAEHVVGQLANVNQQAQAKSVREGQTAEAQLAFLNKPRTPPQRDLAGPMPGHPLESTISGIKYGEGTKLRSFIASGMGDVARETQGAREKWWASYNRKLRRAEEREGDTFKAESRRLTAQSEAYKKVAGSAPTSAYAGGTYYGPGGLAGIAQSAYERSQANLAGLDPADFGSGRPRGEVVPGEDPFLTAIKKKKWQPEYYRKAGTGLARSLTPSVRF